MNKRMLLAIMGVMFSVMAFGQSKLESGKSAWKSYCNSYDESYLKKARDFFEYVTTHDSSTDKDKAEAKSYLKRISGVKTNKDKLINFSGNLSNFEFGPDESARTINLDNINVTANCVNTQDWCTASQEGSRFVVQCSHNETKPRIAEFQLVLSINGDSPASIRSTMSISQSTSFGQDVRVVVVHNLQEEVSLVCNGLKKDYFLSGDAINMRIGESTSIRATHPEYFDCDTVYTPSPLAASRPDTLCINFRKKYASVMFSFNRIGADDKFVPVDNVQIFYNGAELQAGRSQRFEIGKPHEIIFKKQGYEQQTYILDDLTTYETSKVVTLKREYGCVFFDVTSLFSGAEVDDYWISTDGGTRKRVRQSSSYNEEERSIQLTPGKKHILSFEADGYKPFETDVTVSDRDTTIKVQLADFGGTVVVSDAGGGDGASVVVDGVEAGTLNGQTSVVVPIFGKGKHTLTVSKPNFKSFDDSWIDGTTKVFNLEKDDEMFNFQIMLTSYGAFSFNSSPIAARIYVDVNPLTNDCPVSEDYTNSRRVFHLSEGKHTIYFEQDDYALKKIDLDVVPGQADEIEIQMEQIHPISIKVNNDNTRMYLKLEKKEKDGKWSVFSAYPKEVATCDEKGYFTENIPFGDYDMTVYRIKDRTRLKETYKTKLKFNKEGKTKRYIVNPQRHSHIFTFNVFSDISQLSDIPGLINQPGYLANASFTSFALFPGLSTSLLRAAAIRQESMDFNLGLSCIFLNGEFRVGGRIGQYFNVNLLGSYAWCPPLVSAIEYIQIPLSHFSGHDGFVGLEFGTRVQSLNIAFKAGEQFVSGDMFTYVEDSSHPTNINFDETPFNVNRFVVGVTLSLGIKNSSVGQNVLQLFRL